MQKFMSFSRGLRAANLLLFLSLGAGLTACGGEGNAQQAGPVDSEDEPQRPESSLEFRSCGDGMQCAEVEVPLDRNDPEGETISIAINRARASGSAFYRGALFLNPGGPGAGGMNFVASSAQRLRVLFPGFDLIGFDPRGAGESTTLDCPLEADVGAAYFSEGSEGVVELISQQYEDCRQTAGNLLQHMGSNEVVQDIDHIREALGHSEISFYGISYGTRLGALYAQTFPDRIRALVLDSPLGPIADPVALITGQFEAFLTLNEKFYQDCENGSLQCGSNAEAQFQVVLQAFDDAGFRESFLVSWQRQMATSIGRDYNASLLAVTEQMMIQIVTSEEMLDEMMAVDAPPTAADGINGALNYTVTCADSSQPDPTVEEAASLLAGFSERSELFGLLGLPSVVCAGWGVDPDPVPEIEFESEPAPLIIGGLFDALTPLVFAEELSLALAGSSLLRSEHYGHGAGVSGGTCVLGKAGIYLTDLELPEANTVCKAP